jgi:hypothetical protein
VYNNQVVAVKKHFIDTENEELFGVFRREVRVMRYALISLLFSPSPPLMSLELMISQWSKTPKYCTAGRILH